MANILAVQSQGGEARERERFDRESNDSFARHRGVIALAMAAILFAAVPGVLIARERVPGRGRAGIAGARSASATSRCSSPTSSQICVFCVSLGGLWFALQLSAPGLERVFFLMDQEPERDAPGARELPRASRARALRAASPSRMSGGGAALRDVSFEALRGQVTAFVGPAGAGKTTLVSHVPRFLSPASGRVLIDERRRRHGDSRVAARADRVRVPGERPVRGHARGQPAARPPRERPSSSCGARRSDAGVDEFVRSLPDGWRTRAGARRRRVSPSARSSGWRSRGRFCATRRS